MKSVKNPLSLLLLLALGCLLAGCSTPKQDTSIPWSRPANWEGQIPGMGSGGGR